jgi:hypothetical protein
LGETEQRLEKGLHLQTRTDLGDKAYLFLFTRVPPGVRDARRPDRLLACSEEQFLPSHAHAQRPRDDLSPLLLKAVDVLGNIGARRGGIVEAQRSVVCIPGRFEDTEGVPGEAELVPDKGDRGACALPPFPFTSSGWGASRTAPDRYTYPPEKDHTDEHE